MEAFRYHALIYQRLLFLVFPVGWIHASQLEYLLGREWTQGGEPAPAAPVKTVPRQMRGEGYPTAGYFCPPLPKPDLI